MATWRIRSYANQEQRRTVECWPRRDEVGGVAAGREEERRCIVYLGEIRRLGLVGWVRKVQVER